MMNKKQAIGLITIGLIFVALLGLTAEQRINARSRAAEGFFGGAASGAVIGGMIGGGRGAEYGAIAGGSLGLMAGASADRAARYADEDEMVEGPEFGYESEEPNWVSTEGDYYTNRYF